MFLGPMTYLVPKGGGEQQHVRKPMAVSRRRNGALGDPRDMVKAELPEAQSPRDVTQRPSERRLKPAPRPALIYGSGQRTLLAAGDAQ